MQKKLEVGDVFKLYPFAAYYLSERNAMNLVGHYVVTKTAFDGAYYYRDQFMPVRQSGHHVYAKRLLNDDKWDPKRYEIQFYQETAPVGDPAIARIPERLVVLKKMKMLVNFI